jgi:hypothetical protein
LELAARQTLLTSQRHVQLKSDLEEIARMLSGLINSLAKRVAEKTSGRAAGLAGVATLATR